MSYQSEIRASIAKRITKSLEQGKIPWHFGKRGIPTNVITGAKYTGINPLILNCVAQKYDFSSKHWGTKLQWNTAKAKILKKPFEIDEEDYGVHIVNWQENVKEIHNGSDDKFLSLRTFEVFNAKQVVGFGLECCFEVNTLDVVDYSLADNLIKNSNAIISHVEGLKVPHYDRDGDEIKLPSRTYFLNESQYYATVFHELAHFAESRTGFYGSIGQGELIAEIVTATLEATCQLPHDNDLTNHNKYLQEWLDKIHQNPKYLFDAAAAAARSVDCILQNLKHLLEPEVPAAQKMLSSFYFG